MALKPEAALRKDKTNVNSEMQHRHFATVAGIIAGMADSWKERARVHIAHRFADELEHTNPRFDRARFLAACNVKG